MIRVVLDTNVLVAAIRSRKGASHQVLRSLAHGLWELNLSTTLFLEYEALLLREGARFGVPPSTIEAILDQICAVGRENNIFFRWRPNLIDPGDDFLFELALRCQCDYLVTFNQRHLGPVSELGTRVVTPGQFLAIMKG